MSTETVGQTPAPQPPPPPAVSAKEIEEGKVLAILSYIIPILCIVPLIQKNNAFSLYHAKQVLLLVIAGIVTSLVNVIPCLGQIVWLIVALALLVFGVMGLIAAVKGEMKPIPLIGKFAEDWFKGIKRA
jgi:uncharacterized membrane protein